MTLLRKFLPVLGLLAGCAAVPAGDLSGVAAVRPDSETSARARVFTDLAAGYFVRGQYKTVLEELRRAIQIDPQFGPAYNLYGLVYMALAEDALAEENFQRALKLDPNDSVAHNNYGWFLCTRGRYDAGMAEFATAIANPLYGQPDLAMANAGQCAERKGDLAEAENHYKKVLKLTPDNPSVTFRLADLHYRQGRLDEAGQLMGRLAQLAQLDAAALWLGVRIEHKRGDAVQESAYAQQLLRLFPDSRQTQGLKARQYE